MIDLSAQPPRDVWRSLLDLADAEPEGWVLIGAQMVALHGIERNRTPPRASTDADILVNVRLVHRGSEKMSKLLEKLGFTLEHVDHEDIGHRFSKGNVKIDLLAPDGLKGRESRLTVPPAATVCVPGGTQALNRAQQVDVRVGNRTGRLPRPNLLGALLVKTRAIDVDDRPDAQRIDVAFLLSLIDDPRALADDLSPSERKWLRGHKELGDPAAACWHGMDDAHATNGRFAFRILTAAS